MSIRRFREEDAPEVSALITQTLRTTNSRDYTPEYIENIVRTVRPPQLIERAGWTHFYVLCREGAILGCGAIGPFRGREDESSLFNVFVRPDCQGQGIGRQIVRALEADEYALRARRIEVPASITAVGFYRRLGYDYRDGVTEPDGEGLLRLEKMR